MKKIIMLILLTTSIFAFSFSASIPEQAKEETQVICKEGYAFIIVTVHNGNGVSVSITQIMQQSKKYKTPQPMKCKK